MYFLIFFLEINFFEISLFFTLFFIIYKSQHLEHIIARILVFDLLSTIKQHPNILNLRFHEISPEILSFLFTSIIYLKLNKTNKIQNFTNKIQNSPVQKHQKRVSTVSCFLSCLSGCVLFNIYTLRHILFIYAGLDLTNASY